MMQRARNQSRRRAVTPSLLALLLLCLVACAERRQANLIEEADEKISRGAYAVAAEILRKSVAIHPESRTAVKALYKLGFVMETYLKDFEAALFNYNEFIRLSSDPVAVYEVRKRAANLYFEQTNDPDKAAEAYRKLLAANPESLEGDLLQFRIGQSHFRMNDFQKARDEYQLLLDNYPKSQFTARTRYEIGNAYYMEGKYEIGLEALKQVVRLHPQSEFAVEAQFLTAQCLEHLDRFPAAIQTYESILDRYQPKKVIEMRMAEISKKVRKKPLRE